MIVNIDPHSGIPVYRQLLDQIRFLVVSGLLAPGEEIPSTRSLSARLGVNPMTISKAYQLLEREGVLERRPGRPLVVRAQAPGATGATRVEQLRAGLRPLAGKARQLGVGTEQALEVFRQLLEQKE
jgi:GntR family transcriptional regulator